MALLPSLRWDNARWWLPLASETAETLAAVMLADPASAESAAGSTVEPGGGAATGWLVDAMGRDPALLSFIALRRGAAKSSRAGKRVGLRRLARWARPRLVGWFVDGDALLGAPPIDSSQQAAWETLAGQPEALAGQRFAAVATAWLESGGSPVPAGWRATWPRPDWRAGTSPAATPWRLATLALPRLARQIRDHGRLQQHFQRRLDQEKQAALKQFAYGLSHEINNPLANIVTRTQLLQRDEADLARKQSFDRVVQQAMRAHEMIADVMFFAHPPTPQREASDWAECIERAVASFAQRLADASIDWQLTNDSQVPIEVGGDPAMLHDAIAALIRNALEAVGEEGAIHLRLGKRGNKRPKAYVEIADSGPGLSAAAQRHAFDPYYSGREAGRGLGLGLCRVARVAELHGGTAKLTSGPGGCVARLTVRQAGRPSA